MWNTLESLKVVDIMEYTFFDFYNNKVVLSFNKEPFSKNPKHVWVICKFKDQWLLTHHRSRGLEFPGDRKSTRLNSSHVAISYAVFCLKKKINDTRLQQNITRWRWLTL